MKFDENIEDECVTCTGTRTSSKSQPLKYLAQNTKYEITGMHGIAAEENSFFQKFSLTD